MLEVEESGRKQETGLLLYATFGALSSFTRLMADFSSGCRHDSQALVGALPSSRETPLRSPRNSVAKDIAYEHHERMTEEQRSDDLPDHVLHMGRFLDTAQAWPETNWFGRAMTLLGFGAFRVERFPFEDTFENELAAAVTLARCYRQLQASWVVTSHGFHAEARNLLRAVYESAGLARVLAKDPKLADQWLRDGKWFPDVRVRQWLSDVRRDSAEEVEKYRHFYTEASAWAHPTAESCMVQISVEEDHFHLDPHIKFDETVCKETVALLASTSLFACFAFRNAVVDERAIDPAWRKDLYELAREMSNEPMPHLERDWGAEQVHYDAVMANLRDRRYLKGQLRTHPRAYSNLKPRESD